MSRGLLRILRIDWRSTSKIHKTQHALECLRIHVIMGLRLNYKATSRILAECARLESVDQDCTLRSSYVLSPRPSVDL